MLKVSWLFLFLVLSLLHSTVYAIEKPASCRNVNLDRFMQTGQVASAPPDKIYKFTEMRAELLRSLETSTNTACYVDFYQSALSEVGDYWGGRLAQAGCEVNARGEISGNCPDAAEAKKSVQFVGNLDRELRTKVRARLAESREARSRERGAAGNTDECATDKRSPAQVLQDAKETMCCGSSSNNGGVVRAVLPGTNYNSCLGKIRPTNQSFFSGSGLADCLGNAVKAAAQMLWDSISSIFKLPGELWAARSQIWALITSKEARSKFASALMQQFKDYFTNQVDAFKCFNDYEKAQYACRVGGQIIATCALPQTIGAFLGLATKPVGAAARAITQMLQKSPSGNSILNGMTKANEAAARGLRAAGSAADKATGGRLSSAADKAASGGRTVAGVTNAVGRPISILAEKLAAKIEGSATFQKLFVNSFRAERTSMGNAPSTALARSQVLEGEVLPPEPRAPAAPSNAPRLANDNVIEGDFVRVVDDAPPSASAATRLDGPDQASVPRLEGPDQASVPRLEGPDQASVPRLEGPDQASVPRLPAPDSAPAPARALNDSEVDDFVGRMSGRNNLRAQDLDTAGSLSEPQRIRAAQGILDRDLTPEQSNALIRAHNVGSERGFGAYTDQDIAQKREILRSAGYSSRETETLLWKGVAGNPYLEFAPNKTNLTRFMGGRAVTDAEVNAVIRVQSMPTSAISDRVRVLREAGFNQGMAEEIARMQHHRAGGVSQHLNAPRTPQPTPSSSTLAARPASPPAAAARPASPPADAPRPAVAPNTTVQPQRVPSATPETQAAAPAPVAPAPVAPNPVQLQSQAASRVFGDRDPIVRAGDISQMNRTSAQKTLDDLVRGYNNRTPLNDSNRAQHALDRFQEDVSHIYNLKSKLGNMKPGSPEAIKMQDSIRAYQHRCRAWSSLYRAAGYVNDSTIRLFDRDISRVCND